MAGYSADSDDDAGWALVKAVFLFVGTSLILFALEVIGTRLDPLAFVVWLWSEIILAWVCLRWYIRLTSRASVRSLRHRMEAIEPFDANADAAILSRSRRR